MHVKKSDPDPPYVPSEGEPNHNKRKMQTGRQQTNNTNSNTPESKNDLEELEKKSEKALFQTPKYAYNRLLKAYSNKIQELESIIKMQNESIERFKTATLKQASYYDIDREPDDHVQDNLKEKWANVKSWVKRYGIQGYPFDSKDSMLRENLRALVDDPNASTTNDVAELAFTQMISNTTILNARLAKYLLNALLQEPFFFLGPDEALFPHTSLAESITKLHELGCEYSSNKADLWLSQTMSMLQPGSFERLMVNQTQPAAELMKQRYYRSCAFGFLSQPGIMSLLRTLDGENTQERAQMLFNIIKDMGDYLVKLGKQKARMKMLTYEVLKRRLFRKDDPEVRAHPSHSLEEEDVRCNNKPILLVVEPGLLAYGNEDGRMYDQHKVWYPATVIVSDDRRANKHDISSSRDVSSEQQPFVRKRIDLTEENDIMTEMQNRRALSTSVPKEPLLTPTELNHPKDTNLKETRYTPTAQFKRSPEPTNSELYNSVG